MTDRVPTISTESFGRQAAWALAVGAAAAPFGAAQASPVVTTVNQAFPASISYMGAQQFALSGDMITGTGANLIETITGTSKATKLAAGAVIGPATFGSGSGSASLGATFKSDTSYFIGLALEQGAAVNYGYAEIELSTVKIPTSSISVASSPIINIPTTLIEYAFETSANTPITIPGGVPVPEPGSLALLAAGAAGALAVRRRTAARSGVC